MTSPEGSGAGRPDDILEMRDITKEFPGVKACLLYTSPSPRD